MMFHDSVSSCMYLPNTKLLPGLCRHGNTLPCLLMASQQLQQRKRDFSLLYNLLYAILNSNTTDYSCETIDTANNLNLIQVLTIK